MASFLILFAGISTTSMAATEDITLGSEVAPLRITLYTSYSCIDCAEFREKHFGQISEFVEEGHLHLTIRPFVRRQVELLPVALGQCVYSDHGIQSYLSAEKQFYEHGRKWLANNINEARATTLTIAELFGYTETQLESCLNNSEILSKIRQNMNEARDDNATIFPAIIFSRNEATQIENVEAIEREIMQLLKSDDNPSTNELLKPETELIKPEISKAEMLTQCRSGNWQRCYDYHSGNTADGWELIHSLCDQESNAKACEFVAVIYGAGSEGVEKDLAMSAEYHAISCELGNQTSCRRK